MLSHNDNLLAAAKGSDLYDLLEHIAWTDVVKPKLQEHVRTLSTLLVNEALGGPLPPGKTREQIAGMAYGVNYVVGLFERILKDGERAVEALAAEGIKLGAERPRRT